MEDHPLLIPVRSWYEIIGQASIADAILDRLIHTSHRIELKGESLRKKLQYYLIFLTKILGGSI